MTLKVRLAAMMIALLVAVMALQYVLMRRESRNLERRLTRIGREIDESTRRFAEHSLAFADCADSLDVESIVQWIEKDVGPRPDSAHAVVVVRESESEMVELRALREDPEIERLRESRASRPAGAQEAITRFRRRIGGDSSTVRVVLAGHADSLGQNVRALPDGEVEIIKVNLPLPGDVDSPGRSVQLLYSTVSLTEELERARKRSWLWLSGLLGVGAGGAVLAAVQFTRPIRELQTSFGRVVEGDLNVSVVPKRSDEIGRLTGSFNEMVSRLRETREMRERLFEAERLAALGRLAAGVAHEVRNPLNAMLLTMQQLQDKTPPPPGTQERRQFDRYARMVTSELERLERLVSTFLDYSRTGEPSLGPVDLTESLQASIALFETQAAEQGIRIEQQVEGRPELWADAERLRTVWNNLISNALQASGRGKRIHVRARARAELVEVEVEDEGEGIGPDDLVRIWEPFFSGRAEGTGLGLSLVRSIVERHGGEVDAQSERGVGTTIFVRLPRSKSARCE